MPTDDEKELQPPTEPSPEPKPASEDNYKARYQGLQRKYQTLVDASADDQVKIDKLTADLEEYRQSVTTLEKKLETSGEELGASTSKFDDLQASHDALQKKLDRKNLIIAEYPALSEFEAQGLLPDKEGDELKTALGKFQDAIASKTKEGAKELIKSSTPPEPPEPKEPEVTASDHFDLAMKYAGKDTEKFNEHMSTYKEMLDTQEQ